MSSHRAPASTSRLAAPRAVPDAGHPGEHRTIVLDDDTWDDFDDPAVDDPWDDEPQARVLWGRVAVLGGALLLAFLLGRLTAPGDAAALQDAEQRISELSADLVQARAELDAAIAGGAEVGGDQPAAGEDAAATSDDPAAGGEADSGEAVEAQGAAAESDEATGETAGESPDGGDQAAAAEEPAAEEPAAEEPAAEEAAAEEAAAETPIMTTHTVEAGDNLFALAERFYGDGGQWRAIAEANDLPAGAVLAPGQELSIPAEQ